MRKDLTLEGLYLLDMKPIASAFWVNHGKVRIAFLWRRQILQISALSTFDGRVVAYHGVHG